jgi:acetyl esterase/lipase
MIDDRRVEVEDEDFTPFTAFWSHEDNLTGWGALLGKDNIGADNVSEYAAPARAKDLSNLPETYIDVGGLDLFRDHNIEYARRLAAAQVTTEFHMYPGLPHGFEGLGPQSTFLQRAMENRIRALKSF